MAKLKVFRTPIGFHDAYVAAPSRKAALAAWGSAADLFARGVAEEVTDAGLTAEPLAAPGTVIRRSRGTAAEQLAALPPDAVRVHEREADPTSRSAATPKPILPPKPRPPRPDAAALDAAEAALTEAGERHRTALAKLAEREKRLAAERRALERTQEAEAATLERVRDAARTAYDAALRAWRGSR